MLRVAFFGASVTAQKNGFAYCYKKYNNNVITNVFGFGSMHIHDAGICYIDDVLEWNPDVIVTDFIKTNDVPAKQHVLDAIETIIEKCNNRGCKLLFLMLMNNNDENYEEKNKIRSDLCNKYDLNYFDMYKHIMKDKYNNIDINKMFRDGIHTTDYGGDIYARILYENCDLNLLKCTPKIEKIKNFLDVKKIKIEINAFKNVVLNGKCKIIGIEQTIGKYSGIVEIESKDKKIRFNLWDRWCYYERSNIKCSFNVDGKVLLSILDNDFDRSECTKFNEWEGCKKQVKFKIFFYVGDFLEIISFE